MDSDNLHRRLKKIIGQVQAIDRMIDEDVPCEDVLAQINAAKSALHKAGQVVLEGHIKHLSLIHIFLQYLEPLLILVSLCKLLIVHYQYSGHQEQHSQEDADEEQTGEIGAE